MDESVLSLLELPDENKGLVGCETSSGLASIRRRYRRKAHSLPKLGIWSRALRTCQEVLRDTGCLYPAEALRFGHQMRVRKSNELCISTLNKATAMTVRCMMSGPMFREQHLRQMQDR